MSASSPPANHHNAYGDFDPVVHGFNGINSVSLPGYPCGTDGHIIQATKELPSEFPFNLDYNSGYHLGIGKFSFQTAVLLNVLIVENTHRLDTIYYWKQNLQQLSDILSWAKYVGQLNLYVLIRTYVTRILLSDTTSISVLPMFNSVKFTQDSGGNLVSYHT